MPKLLQHKVETLIIKIGRKKLDNLNTSVILEENVTLVKDLSPKKALFH